MMFKKREFATEADNTNEFTQREEGQEKSEKSADTQQLIKEWQRDAEQLKILVGEFDLNEAVKNKIFYETLMSGGTVFEAYKAMTAPPKREPREEILQNAKSGMKGTGGASVNPAKLSSSEFKKYIDNIRNS